MHPLTSRLPRSQASRRARIGRLCGLSSLALVLATAPWPALAASCPWIVQPHAQLASADASTAGGSYDIVFDGVSQKDTVFYGFTVTDLDLAWQLTNPGELPALQPKARALQVQAAADGTAYRVAADTLKPHTIYLVATGQPVGELEQLGARIEPERPVAVSFKTRGGSDLSGPLPHRSLPGVEVKAAVDQPPPAQQVASIAPELQICAYQVALH